MDGKIGSKSMNYKMFGCFNRKFKISEAQPPSEVADAFAKYTDGDSHMSADQFHRFLLECQEETHSTVSDAERIVHEILHRRHHLTEFARHNLTLDDFFHYFFFEDLNGPIRSQVHHDMNAPLQHYFIYTGHNSYLTGNQLSSDCSDLPIIKALQRGVRVIELDIWPNSAKDDIDVLHGRTLTSPVTLIKCLRSIKEYAFVRSPYPLIITLEDHLTADLQEKVAHMITETFGELLYYRESGCLEEFPSPEALKHRIIISTRPPKVLEAERPKVKESSGAERELDVSFSKKEKELVEEEAASEPDVNDGDDSEEDDGDINDCDSKGCKTGAPEYMRLIALHAGKPKNGLREALKIVVDKVKRLSLSEQALERAAENYGTDVVRFTQKNFLRIYPKGTRVTSSNFKPITAWMHGGQMVAFNMQGYGKSLSMMQGMFRSNGGCGYLKKPDFLLTKHPNNDVFDPKVTQPVKKILKVKAYMGDGWSQDFSPRHFDTFSPPDFYTKFYIIGVPADIGKKKTRIIEDDWVPVWNEEFSFPLTVPELALLRIEVREHDRSEKDDFGGQTCLAISELKPGIRAVPLYDKKGEKFKSVKLLIEFRLEVQHSHSHPDQVTTIPSINSTTSTKE
ncbi:phosphoinositide phospholipase C 6-like [Impatiens glandulifera]|uniref:phosphoinositide phospholipase C 6-like n=1 Tax=Impatiens glandulifera TaxID=253017 RepID=UPI001FB0C77C|nr:phosphoinositide phospholipase C 6-like [Impatiens glandulifera]